MRDFEEIRDTSPLGLKKLNDQLRQLWFKTKNATGKDIRFDTIEAGSLIVGNNVSMGPDAYISWGNVLNPPSFATQADIMNFVTSGQVYTIIGQDFVVTGKIYADQIFGTELVGKTIRTSAGALYTSLQNATLSFVTPLGTAMYFGSNPVLSGQSIIGYNAFLSAYSYDGYLDINSSNGVKVNGLVLATQSWVTSQNYSTGIPSSIANVTDIGNQGAQLDGSGGNARLRSASGNTTMSGQNDGNIVFYYSGTAKHVFKSDGTKTGGSIEIEGHNYGMSPVDSPRVLISDLIRDIQATEEGTLVEFDSTLSKAINGYSVFVSGNATITDRTKESFIVTGTEVVDLYVIGTRVQQEEVYWMEMPENEEEEE